MGLETQRELIESLRSVPIKVEGHYLEFGVFTGGTIRFIAKRIGGKPDPRLRQLRGAARGTGRASISAGRAFDVKGRLPRVPANVQPAPRLVRQDACRSGSSDNPGPVAFIHIDCDLYSSTKTIFDAAG